MPKLSIVLCEGPDDVAFISKILKADQFKSKENLPINDYPQPISSMLINEVKETDIEELKFQELRKALLPSAILKKEEHFIFLYAIGGDSRKDIRKAFLSTLISFIPEEGEIEILPKDTELNLLYILDADNLGISARINQINEELEDEIGEKPFNGVGLSKYKTLGLGIYIFSAEHGVGKLEDLLMPLMQENNEDIFKEAKAFYDNFYDVDRDKRKKSDQSKAAIGISGQLQKAGMTNSVIIGQSDYITSEKIKRNEKCQEILTFFSKI